jgi:dihydrodipicolinate reductase
MLDPDDKVLLVGSTGKLGRVIFDFLSLFYPQQVIGIQSQHHLSETIKTYQPSLIIDTTSASCIQQHLKIYHQFKIRTLIGTSGIKSQELKTALKQNYPLLIFINFSYTVTKLIQQSASLPVTHIYETHCLTKKDKPSATALYLQQLFFPSADILSIRVARKIAQHTLITLHSSNLSCTVDHHFMYLPGILFALHTLKKITSPNIYLSPEYNIPIRNIFS